MSKELEGKVVAITGASSGIGRSIALMLASLGARVVIGARREDMLKKLQAQILKSGGESVYAVTDVRNQEDLIQLVSLAYEQFGRLDVIINNAGVAQLSRMEDLDVQGWEDMIDINLKGVLYGIAAALAVFKKQGSGHIINILSTSGIKIGPMQAVYAGTKNAVRTISEALRQESEGRWRITCISPGIVKTELADNIKNPDMRNVMLENSSKLAIAPEDIAPFCCIRYQSADQC